MFRGISGKTRVCILLTIEVVPLILPNLNAVATLVLPVGWELAC